ncbi:hypothetical protein GCM10010174_59510 [Kutzneria viridogrisea]|uniref:Integral membrane protein n=2 Tax=Kutzneria TaxID=43356 RepID=A0ABR6BJY5_9PSEU|nr:hypothetical protein [Kutzneria albida]AHH95435.1 putative membrane protein [Kutzneria albida DSM 43870]MBA8927206.1 hypothetical protein [Kutzneria viridogrisea]
MTAGTAPEAQKTAYFSVQGTIPETKPRTPLDELRERMTSLCAAAVDPFEIAAGLEADGLSDQAVQRKYGFSDVFTLAEELYRQVPREPEEPEPLPDPWTTKRSTHVVHGLLFGLPALCYPAAAPLLGGGPALTVLVVSMLISWSLSQAVAYLGYSRTSALDNGGAARVLRLGMAASVGLLALVLGVLLLVSGAGLPVVLFALGQGIYLMAATVLLVRKADKWLFIALAPGVLASLGYVVAGEPQWLNLPVWCVLAGSVLLSVGFAVHQTWNPAPANGPLVTRQTSFGALPYALFGVLTAGLLAFPVVAATAIPALGTKAAPVAALPLSLSMGAAEWNLYWYRSRMRRESQATTRVSRFVARSRLVLGLAVVRYLVVAVLLFATVITTAALIGAGRPEWTQVPAYTAYLALGAALFIALLLQACGSTWTVLPGCAAALLTEVSAAVGAIWFGWRIDLISAQLLACCGLLAVLAVHASVALGQATKHR